MRVSKISNLRHVGKFSAGGFSGLACRHLFCPIVEGTDVTSVE